MFWKALPHAAAAPSHTPVSSQNQPQTAPKLSWVWVERQKRWPPGTWRRQRGELSVKFLQNIQSLSPQQMKRPTMESLVWQPCYDPCIIYTNIFLSISLLLHRRSEIDFFSPHNYISQLSHQTLHAFGAINEKDREVSINISHSW